ncbi:DUF5011 domain-containing protein, partial [Lacrimispora saccharolytica]|nr:DUF5011 domain-containing protein [Lacrimispora saccharolytica]
MKKGLVAMLLLACAALLAGNVVIYIGKDRNGPDITVPQEELTYVAGSDTSALLNGVTAVDDRDGDVTSTVTVESIIPNEDQTGASVIYVAKDSKNNVTKATRLISYAADAGQAAAQEAEAAAQQAAQEAAAADQTAASGEDAQTADDGAAQNEAAIAALPAESPRFYLTQYSVEVERGAELNRLGYVQDITDDKDSRDELYQGIQISGEVDTNTPGEYMLEYYVVDSDGNTS